MTQLFRAAAPHVVPGSPAEGRTSKPGSRFARAASLLAIAGLAGCADVLTEPAPQPFAAPRMSEATVVGQYTIPTAPSSLGGTSAVPWTNTGITVPRAGKYRIRVQGAINVTKHPSFPGQCTQQPLLTQFLGDWGPQGRPELGLFLRVGVYNQAAGNDFGYPVRIIDATTIETEQQLEASTPIWVVRRALGAQIICPTPTSPPIPMFALAGSQVVTVTEVPGLECKGTDGRTEIERAQTVRCSITPDKPYKVKSRRATGTGFTNSAEPDSSFPANTPYVWEGPAVTNTQVQMVIETTEDTGPRQTTHTADFTVRARDWPKLQLAAPTVTVGISGSLQLYPGNKVLGNARPFIPPATLNALPVTRPAAGPNMGLSFLTDPLPTISHSIHIHPGLYNNPATPTSPDQQWRRDQDGVGSGNCTSSVFGDLRRTIERHEGVTQANNSHWGITARFFRDHEPEQRIEEVFKNGDEAALRQDVRAAWLRQITTGPHKTQQTAFDVSDYAQIDAALGCALDYNLSDT